MLAVHISLTSPSLPQVLFFGMAWAMSSMSWAQTAMLFCQRSYSALQMASIHVSSRMLSSPWSSKRLR